LHFCILKRSYAYKKRLQNYIFYYETQNIFLHFYTYICHAPRLHEAAKTRLIRNASACNGNTGYNCRDVGTAKTVSKKALSAYVQRRQAWQKVVIIT